ncbi:hypothetical protein FBU30_007107 [Linnemannia zychae]|nr:hypothetical protein FBU30_007107 [Linnemannia zychae]
MTTIGQTPISRFGPAMHHYHHNTKLHHISLPPPPCPPPPPPPKIMQCGICLDDFEWFSLKDLKGFQEDPKDTSAATVAALSRLPQICQRPIHIFCNHSRNQVRIRSHQSPTHGGRLLRFFKGDRTSRREQKLKQVAANDSPSLEPLKLGCSLHTGNDHAFCLECLARYVDTQVKAQAWPIVCPYENCREIVSSFAVETLLGSDALQWHRLAVEHAIQKKIYCPYPECGRLMDGDRNDEQEPVDRHCPYCNKPFCAMCQGESHKGINCEQRLDKIFDTLATESKWKNCPNCRHMIEKESVQAPIVTINLIKQIN